MWKFRHRTRGREQRIEEPEKRHLTGRKTLITVVVFAVLQEASNGSMLLGVFSRKEYNFLLRLVSHGHVNPEFISTTIDL